MPFIVDTGAGVAVVQERYTQMLWQEIKPPSKQFHRLESKPWQVLEEIQARITYKDKEATQTCGSQLAAQLQLSAIPALNILTRVNAIAAPTKEQFPSLFTGLGTFPGSSYDIQLKLDAKPFALSLVPLPLRQKDKDEFTRMEDLGVVQKPTPWCASTVAIQKK